MTSRAIILLSLLLSGAVQGENRVQSPMTPAADAQTIMRVHWLGMANLMRESKGTAIEQIGNMAEWRSLREQTLEKLSRAPYELLRQRAAGGRQPLRCIASRYWSPSWSQAARSGRSERLSAR